MFGIGAGQRKIAENRALSMDLKLSDLLRVALESTELDSKWQADVELARARAEGMLQALN